MWPPAGRIRAECPSSSFMIRNQRHPQRHPRRNCLFRRYGESLRKGPSGRDFVGRTELVQVCGQFLYRSGGADLVSHPGAHGGLDARMGASLVPRHPRHRSERSSPRRGRELEPHNGVLRAGVGSSRCPARCRAATDRTREMLLLEFPAGYQSGTGHRRPWLPSTGRLMSGEAQAPHGPTSAAGSQRATPGQGGPGSERSESDKRRPDGEARNEPTRRVTSRAGASERRP
jgi:hypothetical protein